MGVFSHSLARYAKGRKMAKDDGGSRKGC